MNSDDMVKDGVRVVTLASWQEFHQKVLSLRSKRGYVWRGQKQDEDHDWFLWSKFDRKVQRNDEVDRVNKLKRHLHDFKREMNKSYPHVLPRDDVDVWALGQHYGLWTPLLDWTLSPYIAAYFAFEGWGPDEQDDCYRYVYALNRSLERHLSKQKKASEILSTARSVLLMDKLPHANPRFSAQKGIFTKAFQGNKIEEYVQSFSRKRASEVVLVKFRIPTKDREECLRHLHLMNIDQMSLLLDLRDVVDDLNNKL